MEPADHRCRRGRPCDGSRRHRCRRRRGPGHPGASGRRADAGTYEWAHLSSIWRSALDRGCVDHRARDHRSEGPAAGRRLLPHRCSSAPRPPWTASRPSMPQSWSPATARCGTARLGTRQRSPRHSAMSAGCGRSRQAARTISSPATTSTAGGVRCSRCCSSPCSAWARCWRWCWAWSSSSGRSPANGFEFGSGSGTELFTNDLANLFALIASVAILLPVVLLATLLIERRPIGSLSSVQGRLRWRWLALCLLPAVAYVLASSGPRSCSGCCRQMRMRATGSGWARLLAGAAHHRPACPGPGSRRGVRLPRMVASGGRVVDGAVRQARMAGNPDFRHPVRCRPRLHRLGPGRHRLVCGGDRMGRHPYRRPRGGHRAPRREQHRWDGCRGVRGRSCAGAGFRPVDRNPDDAIPLVVWALVVVWMFRHTGSKRPMKRLS